MNSQIEITAYLPLIVSGMTLEEQIECTVTVEAVGNGCGEYEMEVVRIERENQTGTGWFRWDRKDIKGSTLPEQVGAAFFKAAEQDDNLEANFFDRLRNQEAA